MCIIISVRATKQPSASLYQISQRDADYYNMARGHILNNEYYWYILVNRLDPPIYFLLHFKDAFNKSVWELLFHKYKQKSIKEFDNFMYAFKKELMIHVKPLYKKEIYNHLSLVEKIKLFFGYLKID